jgi:hydrogenase 3 maturation protease
MPAPETAALRKALERALGADASGKGRAAAHARGPVVVLGVGSPLRSDDSAGLRLAALVTRAALPGVHAIEAGPAPENCTAEVRRLCPSHLVIVDAADLGEPPGTIRLIAPELIGSTSFGTHGLPLGVVADYLRSEVGCRVVVVGVQPKSLAFGEELSPEVEAAVGELSRALAACLG